jgi:hypothetical protein
MQAIALFGLKMVDCMARLSERPTYYLYGRTAVRPYLLPTTYYLRADHPNRPELILYGYNWSISQLNVKFRD